MLNHQPFDFPLSHLINTLKCGLDHHSHRGIVVAGGYLRDHLLEREQRDIDVYIDVRDLPEQASQYTYEQIIDKALEYKRKDLPTFTVKPHFDLPIFFTVTLGPNGQLIIQHHQVPVAPSYATAKKSSAKIDRTAVSPSGIVAVVERALSYPSVDPDGFEIEIVYPVQFIFICQKPVQYVEQEFNSHISKVHYDGLKVTMTRDFVWATMNKFNIFRKRRHDSVEKFNDYVDKIKEKYPDFVHHTVDETENQVVSGGTY